MRSIDFYKMETIKTEHMIKNLSSLLVGVGIAIGTAAILGFKESPDPNPSPMPEYTGSWQMEIAPNGTAYYYSTSSMDAYYIDKRYDGSFYWHRIYNSKY
jgi:hypothetical protein